MLLRQRFIFLGSQLRKLGAKNIEAGIGCGVGFGLGFGVGFAIKPRVVNQLQLFLIKPMANVMMKLGISPSLPAIQGVLPGGLSIGNASSISNPVGTAMNMTKKIPEQLYGGIQRDKNVVVPHPAIASKLPPLDSSYTSGTEQVLNSFLGSPLLKEEVKEVNDSVHEAEQLRSENNILQMICIGSTSSASLDHIFPWMLHQRRRLLCFLIKRKQDAGR